MMVSDVPNTWRNWRFVCGLRAIKNERLLGKTFHLLRAHACYSIALVQAIGIFSQHFYRWKVFNTNLMSQLEIFRRRRHYTYRRSLWTLSMRDTGGTCPCEDANEIDRSWSCVFALRACHVVDRLICCQSYLLYRDVIFYRPYGSPRSE